MGVVWRETLKVLKAFEVFSSVRHGRSVQRSGFDGPRNV
jgi:hypothetical protein